MIEPTWQTADGRVRLYLGDCLDILPTLGGIDAVVTDPPYEITATGGGIGADRKYLADIDGFTDCGFDPSVVATFPNWMAFCTAKQLPGMFSHVGERRWMIITWNKPNPAPLCCGNYLPDTEYIFHCWTPGNLFGECGDKSRFVVLPARQGLAHPNEKPLALMRKLVRNASDVGKVVCDPYMGSGTTGLACVDSGRSFVGIERERKYFAIAKRRIEAELNRHPMFEPKPKIINRQLPGMESAK